MSCIRINFLKTTVVIVLLVGLLQGCGAVRECCQDWSPLDYTVVKGDTLYSIAWRYEMDYRDIARWNDISSPYAIFPGQRLRMSPDTAAGTIDHQPPVMTMDDDSSDVPVASIESVVKPESRALFIEVVKGDTLYSIARSHQLTPHQLARWNALRPPYEIYPGQKLRTQPPQEAYGSSASTIIQQAKVEPLVDAGSTAIPQPQEESLPATVNAWHWPVKGPIVKTFDKKDTSRKGIGIAGKPGQAIKATAAGKVVYSGNGLISYGNLIIIKHSNAFLSAYAYNKKLLVNEGDSVRSGQVIAHMGTVENGRSQLHFEIRKDGKPVNPLKFLPKI